MGPEPEFVFVITAYDLGPKAFEGAAPPPPEKEMKQGKFPPGWDEERVRRVLEHSLNITMRSQMRRRLRKTKRPASRNLAEAHADSY